MKAVRQAIARVIGPRALFGLAATSVVATWLMLLIGGTVNPTQSSLACPWSWDHLWSAPSCGGLPMEGGVVFEHGHRLWGWVVGWLAVVVMIGAWASGVVHRRTKWLAFAGVWLVLTQGALGGLTVLVGLHPVISTAHLVVGYSYLALTFFIAWRLLPSRAAAPQSGERHPRARVMWAAALVLLQILVGGALRHTGPGGMICGTDAIGCNGLGLWPDMALQQLHMLHRVLGYAATLYVAWVAVASMREARRADVARPHVARLAWAPLALVVAQTTLGLLTVISGKVVGIVMFHTALGGLLLTSLIALFLGFGPLGARRAASPTAAARSTAAPSGAAADGKGAFA
ncbi:MAG: COX15/CtaA family protein [Deltaproteobacteria bacterium]|nr:COX15/CtaA family protein [Deltaproteobacteria bacterium]